MKVIFIQNVAKHGKIGDIKDVADGFAVNVLFPKKQAILATKESVKKIEDAKKNKEFQKEISKNLFLKAMNDLKTVLNQKNNGFLEIKVKNQDKLGHLFSQIKEIDIIDAIYKEIKISLSSDQIILGKEHIKKIGRYQIVIKNGKYMEKINLLIK